VMGECMICTVCEECTGYGSSCVNSASGSSQQDRSAAQYVTVWKLMCCLQSSSLTFISAVIVTSM